MKKFDYYIFIDYSENLIGYLILNGKNVEKILPLCKKLKHYSSLKYKTQYIRSMKKHFKKNNLYSLFDKFKITELRNSLEIYGSILEFIKNKDNLTFFISVDDRQYNNFQKLIGTFDGENSLVVREGKLKKKSKEYFLNLLIDTLLNIERKKKM